MHIFHFSGFEREEEISEFHDPEPSRRPNMLTKKRKESVIHTEFKSLSFQKNVGEYSGDNSYLVKVTLVKPFWKLLEIKLLFQLFTIGLYNINCKMSLCRTLYYDNNSLKYFRMYFLVQDSINNSII